MEKIPLIWDGGNLVTNGEIGFITDQILVDNKIVDNSEDKVDVINLDKPVIAQSEIKVEEITPVDLASDIREVKDDISKKVDIEVEEIESENTITEDVVVAEIVKEEIELEEKTAEKIETQETIVENIVETIEINTIIQPTTGTENNLTENISPSFFAESSINSTHESSIIKYADLEFMYPLSFDEPTFEELLNISPLYRKYNDSIDFYTPPSERTSWLLEAYFSPLYTSGLSESINTEMGSYIEDKTKIESPVISFTTGLNVQYQGKNNLLFQTGIAYTELGERIKREDIEQINTYLTPLHPDGGYTDIDTILFINIDSLNQGIHYVDTLFDSNWIVDNTQIETSDTTKFNGANNRNKYSYLEIPIMVGYSFPGPKFDFQIKAGVITGIWLNTNGFKPDPYNSLDLIDINSDSPKFKTVNYSLVAGFNLNYHILERVNITTGIMYRKNLFDIYDSYLYSQKHFATEFHIGIQYQL